MRRTTSPKSDKQQVEIVLQANARVCRRVAWIQDRTAVGHACGVGYVGISRGRCARSSGNSGSDDAESVDPWIILMVVGGT